MPLNDACPPAFVGFVILYHILAPYCKTTKQRAWILTALSSCITSVAAVPYAYDFFSSGGQLGMLRPTDDWSNRVVGVFQGYLLADLTLGVLYYRECIALLTGWIHHTLYFFLLHYIFTVGWTSIFCLALIMEIPTLILALGSLHAGWRNDYLFASTFFATRIIFHLTLMFNYARAYMAQPPPPLHLALNPSASLNLNTSSMPKTNLASPISALPNPLTSPLPALFFLAAFPMHVMWFTGCVRGILKRRAQCAAASRTPLLVSTVRMRFQAMRRRLRMSREDRERLRARLGAVYGNARERMMRKGLWARRMAGVYEFYD